MFYVARRMLDHNPVMVNVLPVKEQHPLHELLSTRDCVHPNIVLFTEYYEEPGDIKWLILDYMRGDWLNNVVARNYLEEDHVARIAAEVCNRNE
jgi:serine/threonine protein kinase